MTARRWTVAAAALLLAGGGTGFAYHAHGQVASAMPPRGQVAPATPARIPATAPRRPAPRLPIPVGALLPSTQALFDGWVQHGQLPGIVGGFGRGDAPTLFVTSGRIALEGSAPAADADTLWRVYSMTKPITGMAAMLLVEDGRLKLDDPVSKFFPGFAAMRVLTRPDTSLDSVPARSQITVRELLTHTAGLGYAISAKGPLLQEYERLGLLPAQINADTEAKARQARPTSLAEFARRVATAPLIAQPGTTWSYSMGLDVLAAVIEQAAGVPFERFVQTRLLTPLAMRSTYWQVPGRDAGRLATNYLSLLGGLVPLDVGSRSVYLAKPSFAYGGAGLVSSARDYDRFLHMLQDGGTLDGVAVMKPETAALGMSNLLPPGVSFVSDGKPTGFGAGGFVTLADVPGGPMKGTYGWSGAATTQAWVDPARHARGVIMVNINPYNVVDVRTATVAALARDAGRLGG